MTIFNKNTQILSDLQIDVVFQDIEKKIKTSGKSPGIFKVAQKTLEEIQGRWEPAAVFQWFDFKIDPKTGLGQIIQPGSAVQLDLGPSIQFLEQARHVMVSAYTIGQGLDTESANASSNGRLLEGYLMDLIGLTVLGKVEDIIKKNVENMAFNLGWGVGPFLSPGSVHGWELDEQSKLCSLLPIERINVNIENNTVLFPLKSVVAVIGIGPGYDATQVGSTCDVCSNRDTCQMRQND
jgi:hypothetical protein